MQAQEIFDKLTGDYGVLHMAVSSHDQPMVSTMKFGYRDGKFYFQTWNHYRKYSCLKQNPKIGLALTDNYHTIQVEGVAEELPASEGIRILEDIRGEPSDADHEDAACFFAVTPNFIRVLVDHGPPLNFEVLLDHR